MSTPIRVLVVDDSAVIRRLLVDSLSHDSEIEVIGTAPNGRIALSKIQQLKPDVITLDVEMPEMNGIETVRAIRMVNLDLPIIMFSTRTSTGAEVTLDCLEAGADDYVTKPANVGSVSDSIREVQNQLIPKIKSLFEAKCLRLSPTKPPASPPSAPISKRQRPNLPHKYQVLGIGSSTGGPNALTAVLTGLPAPFPLPILIVQHMPPIFTKHLADRLSQTTGHDVREAVDGELILAGRVYMAPGDYHMTACIQGGHLTIRLQQEAPENSCRPAVDVLFRSLAQTFRHNTIGVVLTGMGTDGLKGGQEIYYTGGNLIAQDEATSVVWGMPGAISRAGIASSTVPLFEVATEVMTLREHEHSHALTGHQES